eukprot:4871314-Amphidinium_carterae.1
MWCDNTAAITLANGAQPMRTRHWTMRSWALHDAVTVGEVTIEYVQSQEQQADSLTKLLSSASLGSHNGLLGLVAVDC